MHLDALIIHTLWWYILEHMGKDLMIEKSKNIHAHDTINRNNSELTFFYLLASAIIAKMCVTKSCDYVTFNNGMRSEGKRDTIYINNKI